jgi:O-antigen ligase
VVTATLFVRPADFVPALLGLEIYQFTILVCLAVSFPAVLGHLSAGRLEGRSIDLCVAALLPAVLLSHLARVDFGGAWESGVSFLKILVYYFLFVSLVTTPSRLRLYTSVVVLCSAVVVVVAAMDFYGMLALPRAQRMGRTAVVDPNRLYGPGIFQDPNDICVLIVTATMLLLGKLADRRSGLPRLGWLLPLGVFAFGFYLTKSRGGLLALLAGLGMTIRLRWGWGRALLLGAVGAPVLLALLGGRQTDISTTTDTGQDRIGLWSDALVMFKGSPVFGAGLQKFEEEAGHVAHNSFLEYFAELGMVGGVCYLGAVYLALSGLYRLRKPVLAGGRAVVPVILDPDLRQSYPYLGGALTAYSAGMMTLSLNGLVITYALFGLAANFLALAATRPAAAPQQRLDGGLVVRLVGMSLLFLAAMHVFVRTTFRV